MPKSFISTIRLLVTVILAVFTLVTESCGGKMTWRRGREETVMGSMGVRRMRKVTDAALITWVEAETYTFLSEPG